MKRAPTPETDEEHKTMPMGEFTLDFARKLERERDEAIQSCHIWQKGHSEMVERCARWEDVAYDKLSELSRQIEKTRIVTEQRNTAISERDILKEALDDYVSAFGQELELYGVPYVPTNQND